jgi:ABC-2 type transport system permease protein
MRTSTLVWIVGGGLAMYGEAMAIATEMADFPGGPRALAASIQAGAEAMRILRWPAERLDTLGGYVTYHNVVLFNLFLVIYGAVQGAKAVRGGEERRTLEEVLAAGASRAAVVRDRTLGVAIALAAVNLGLALGVAAGLAGGGAPDIAGSFVTLTGSFLVSMVGYGLGLLVSQLTSARAAAGVSAAVVTGLYVLTNIGDELDALAFLQHLSPFTWANRMRALVPGYAFDPLACAVLLAMTGTLVALATAAFLRRDYASPLWTRRPHAAPAAGAVRLPTLLLGHVWTATVRRGAAGLVAWALGAASLTALMASLEPAVMDVWSAFDFIGAIAGTGPGVTIEDAYWSFTGALVSPVLAAYAVVQASSWVADLAHGRVETLLAGPVTWTRLVLGRLVALVVGLTVITGTAIVVFAVGAAAVGSGLDAAGAGRLGVTCVVFGAALGSIGAVLVAWLRRGSAVTALAAVAGASYLLAYFIPLFGWPDWLNRLSVFWAFGQPYLEWPSAGQLTVLLVLAIAGAVAAALIAERTPKVA